jgi:hypothetical protein
MMELERLFGHVRRQCVTGVRQFWQCECHCHGSFRPRGRPVASDRGVAPDDPRSVNLEPTSRNSLQAIGGSLGKHSDREHCCSRGGKVGTVWRATRLSGRPRLQLCRCAVALAGVAASFRLLPAGYAEAEGCGLGGAARSTRWGQRKRALFGATTSHTPLLTCREMISRNITTSWRTGSRGLSCTTAL